MAEVYEGRYTAAVEGDFVVFMIGMRINKLWKLNRWVPVFREMGPMIKTLFRSPEKGMLDARFGWLGGGPLVVQYWKSFEDLDRFARNPKDVHRPAWGRYNRSIGTSGDVGVWHETYRVRAGDYECVYANMPRVGLAAAGEHLPVRPRSESAAMRLGVPEPQFEEPEPEAPETS